MGFRDRAAEGAAKERAVAEQLGVEAWSRQARPPGTRVEVAVGAGNKANGVAQRSPADVAFDRVRESVGTVRSVVNMLGQRVAPMLSARPAEVVKGAPIPENVAGNSAVVCELHSIQGDLDAIAHDLADLIDRLEV